MERAARLGRAHGMATSLHSSGQHVSSECAASSVQPAAVHRDSDAGRGTGTRACSALTAPAFALKTDATGTTGAPCAALPWPQQLPAPCPRLLQGVAWQRRAAIPAGQCVGPAACAGLPAAAVRPAMLCLLPRAPSAGCVCAAMCWATAAASCMCAAMCWATAAASCAFTLGASLPAPSGPFPGLTWMRLASA